MSTRAVLVPSRSRHLEDDDTEAEVSLETSNSNFQKPSIDKTISRHVINKRDPPSFSKHTRGRGSGSSGGFVGQLDYDVGLGLDCLTGSSRILKEARLDTFNRKGT